MKITITPITNITAFVIDHAPSLDPIRVILQDTDPGEGRIIIGIFGRAWEMYFGSIGKRSIAAFVSECDIDYLATKFARRPSDKQEIAYLMRIVPHVKDGCRKLLEDHQA